MSVQDRFQLPDEMAAAYERDFVPAYFHQWPAVIADIVGLAPNERVLDVACGTGAFARYAAGRVGASGRVTGLDLNPGMLAVARRLAPEINWQTGDAESLPFAEGSFDVAVSQMALMFIPDKVKALREMWRVLAPGGRLAAAVCAPIAASPAYERLAAIVRREAGPEAATMLATCFALGDEAQLLELAAAAGLSKADVERREGWMRFPTIDRLLAVEIKGTPLAGLVSAAAFHAVSTAAHRELAAFRDTDGGFAARLDASVLTAQKP